MAQRSADADVDRLRELASIGAGHAANALARMLGRPCAMQVPRTLALDEAGDEDGDRLGLFFDLEGGPGGMVALIFGADVRARLLDALLGVDEPSAEQAESALRELGNILVSHVASSPCRGFLLRSRVNDSRHRESKRSRAICSTKMRSRSCPIRRTSCTWRG